MCRIRQRRHPFDPAPERSRPRYLGALEELGVGGRSGTTTAFGVGGEEELEPGRYGSGASPSSFDTGLGETVSTFGAMR